MLNHNDNASKNTALVTVIGRDQVGIIGGVCTKLAEMSVNILDISQTVYSRYERGFQTIPVQHLIKLADYYHTSTDYLLGRTNNPKPYR